MILKVKLLSPSGGDIFGGLGGYSITVILDDLATFDMTLQNLKMLKNNSAAGDFFSYWSSKSFDFNNLTVL